MAAKIVEISLKSLKWHSNGELDQDKEGNNVLTFELVYPAPGKTNISTIKKLKLKNSGSINLEGKNPGTKKPYTYSDRILFKEEIYGESPLVVQLTDVQTPSGLDKFFGSILKGLYKTVFGILTGSIGNVVVGLPVSALKSEMDSLDTAPEGRTDIIGENSISIKADELPEPGESKRIQLDLEVPRNVIRYETKYDGDYQKMDGKWIKIERTVLKAGTSNGTIELNIKVL